MLFPAIILLVGMVTGLLYYLMVNIGAYVVPVLGFLGPLEGLQSFVQVTLFGVVFFLLVMAWYAPFFAWVGGLSTVFGRWSLPLAFVIPGLLAVIENVVVLRPGTARRLYLAATSPTAGTTRLSTKPTSTVMAMDSRPFSASFFIGRMIQGTNWTQMGIGLAFAVDRDLAGQRVSAPPHRLMRISERSLRF